MNNWLVLGPGRTGSKLLTHFIRCAMHDQGITAHCIAPARMPHHDHNNIIHSHDVDSYRVYQQQNYTCIISTRDIIESTFSWLIQPQLTLWHFYNLRERNSVKIQPIHIDPKAFEHKYQEVTEWYLRLAHVITAHAIVIDYTEFKHHAGAIAKILHMPIPRMNHMPLPNPGSHAEWISNWPQLCDMSRAWPRIPRLSTPKQV